MKKLFEKSELALAIVMIVVSPPPQFSGNKVLFYVLLGVVVFAIYLLVMLMTWLQKSRESKKLTEQLKKLQAG